MSTRSNGQHLAMTNPYEELAKYEHPARGKKLDRLAEYHGVPRNRRFLYREGDKSLRRRTIESLNRHPGTLADIKASAEGQCVGVRDAVVVDCNGEVFVRLFHRWWAWPWKRGNIRRAEQYLRRYSVAAGVRLEVK